MTPKQLVRLSACAIALAVLAFSLSAPRLARAAPAAIVVNDSSDGAVCPIFLTLRCAINYANNPIHPGTSIRFEPDLAPVMLQSALPAITADFTWIDGYDNTNGTCCQVIDGSSMPANGYGLTINASYVTISNMTVVNLRDGIEIVILGGIDTAIAYDYLGILPGATQCANLSTWNGIEVFNDRLGSAGSDKGTAYIYGNTIGCHNGPAVTVWNSNYVYVGTQRDGTPLANYIGTTSDHTSAARNREGVWSASNSDHVTIRGNQISYSAGAGVAVDGGSNIDVLYNTLSANQIGLGISGGSAERITQNKIGTSADGTLPLPNTWVGIYISGGSDLLLWSNLVAYNGAAGIAVAGDSTHALIRENDIYRNGGLPIDLGNDGPTANGAQSPPGPNNWLAYPVVTAYSGSLVQGTTNCANCAVMIFKASGNPAAAGGGGVYLMSLLANAFGQWSVTLPGGLTGLDVTFVALDSAYANSSEMSPRPQVLLPLIRR